MSVLYEMWLFRNLLKPSRLQQPVRNTFSQARMSDQLNVIQMIIRGPLNQFKTMALVRPKSVILLKDMLRLCGPTYLAI